MPNAIAYLALLSWPLVIWVMFRKMPVERAFIWAILGGYMVLPELTEFNLPMIPPLDKASIPNLTAAFICIAVLKLRPTLLPVGLFGKALVLMLIAAPVISVFHNLEPIIFAMQTSGQLTVQQFPLSSIDQGAPAPRLVPGMRMYDAFSALAQQLILILPFFLARHILATEAALRDLLRALVIAGLIYSVPILIEIRFSPQLHTWIYGFFQHDFIQMIRRGGFRPIVFMPHGLWLALFMVMTATAALHFALQAEPEKRPRAILIAFWLIGMVVLTRSVGPLLIMLVVGAIVLLFAPRMQFRLAAAMAGVAMSYPLLRGGGLIPTEQLVSLVHTRSPERAQSLEFRFDNEDMLLERASEKPFFGWGGWGRNQIFDPVTGEVLSVSDGMWIITIGQWGWLGYLAMFGLLCLPLLALWWRYRLVPNRDIPPAAGVLAVILGASLIDLLPNATMVPLTWLIAGALLGHAELQHWRAQQARLQRWKDQPSRAGLMAGARSAAPGFKHSFL